MRLSPQAPSYKPSYAQSLITPPPKVPTFSGQSNKPSVTSTGISWKAKFGLVFLVLSSIFNPVLGAKAPHSPRGKSEVSTATTEPSLLETLIPTTTVADTTHMTVAANRQANAAADQKRTDARKLEQKNQEKQLEQKKADEKLTAHKMALQKRDDDRPEICRRPDKDGGGVVWINWWGWHSGGVGG